MSEFFDVIAHSKLFSERCNSTNTSIGRFCGGAVSHKSGKQVGEYHEFLRRNDGNKGVLTEHEGIGPGMPGISLQIPSPPINGITSTDA